MKKLLLIGMGFIVIAFAVYLYTRPHYDTSNPYKLARLYMEGMLNQDTDILEGIYYNRRIDGYLEHQLEKYGGYDLRSSSLRIADTESSYFKSIHLNGNAKNASGNTIAVHDLLYIRFEKGRWVLSAARY